MHFYDKMYETYVRDFFDVLNKIFMFDIQLVFDTYIASLVSEVETAKNELESYAQRLEEQVAERTAQLKELSRKDELTGLFNQRGFYEHLRREAANAERHLEDLSLAYFDLDGFKILNDTQGHVFGDTLLALVGKVLRENLREIDIACRYGGDEFCIIMPRTALDDAKMVVERIIDSFKQENNTNVSFSIGITSTGSNAMTDSDSLLKEADALMYKAKAKYKKQPGFHICTK